MAPKPDAPPDISLLQRYVGQLETRLFRLEVDTTGNGGDGFGMSAWQQSVENRLASVDARLASLSGRQIWFFVITWGGIIGTTLGLAGLVAKGFGWL